jgi:hypothetical protein
MLDAQACKEGNRGRQGRCPPRHVRRVPTPVIIERFFRAHVLAEIWTLQLAPSRPATIDLKTTVNTP